MTERISPPLPPLALRQVARNLPLWIPASWRTNPEDQARGQFWWAEQSRAQVLLVRPEIGRLTAENGNSDFPRDDETSARFLQQFFDQTDIALKSEGAEILWRMETQDGAVRRSERTAMQDGVPYRCTQWDLARIVPPLLISVCFEFYVRADRAAGDALAVEAVLEQQVKLLDYFPSFANENERAFESLERQALWDCVESFAPTGLPRHDSDLEDRSEFYNEGENTGVTLYFDRLAFENTGGPPPDPQREATRFVEKQGDGALEGHVRLMKDGRAVGYVVTESEEEGELLRFHRWCVACSGGARFFALVLITLVVVVDQWTAEEETAAIEAMHRAAAHTRYFFQPPLGEGAGDNERAS
jgi:hypothetical protein